MFTDWSFQIVHKTAVLLVYAIDSFRDGLPSVTKIEISISIFPGRVFFANVFFVPKYGIYCFHVFRAFFHAKKKNYEQQFCSSKSIRNWKLICKMIDEK